MTSLSPDSTWSRKEALALFRQLNWPRRIENRMLRLLRQNKINKWFSGIGQEAIAVGVTRAVDGNDYLLPMHRNLGIFTTRNTPLYTLFCQLLERREGFTRGRDRTFHFGSLNHHIIGMISHLAAMLPVGDGLALASKLQEQNQMVVCICGEGATSEGDFHEAVNLAAVWNLPVLFLIENNGYALSTPTKEQYACDQLVDRAVGYGIEGKSVDGNNIFEVIESIEQMRGRIVEGNPVLLEAETFRLRGHEEASGTWYVPDDLLEKWKQKDPILQFDQWIKNEYQINDEELEKIRSDIDEQLESPLQKALKAPGPRFERSREEEDVLTSVRISEKQSNHNNIDRPAEKAYDHTADIPRDSTSNQITEKRFIDGIQQALLQAFEEDESFILMGQDIAEYGGVFKVTDGFLEHFGPARIRNTPIIESAAIGTALGLALEGFKPVVEMQFADFISCGFNQIVNNVAKGQWRWMPSINLTIRGPHGAGVGAGPFHSASPEGWFMPHTGLKIAVPATVRDAQQLLYSSLYDPNPVLFFEHKALYRSLKSGAPDQCFFEPLGTARLRQEGTDAGIITYGQGVHWALDITEELQEKEGMDISVLDLRTLNPIDFDAVKQLVQNSNKILLLQEPSRTMGPMSEVSSFISEKCFEWLDAPIMRCSSIDTPVPASSALEEGYMAKYRLKEKLQKLMAY